MPPTLQTYAKLFYIAINSHQVMLLFTGSKPIVGHSAMSLDSFLSSIPGLLSYLQYKFLLE